MSPLCSSRGIRRDSSTEIIGEPFKIGHQQMITVLVLSNADLDLPGDIYLTLSDSSIVKVPWIPQTYYVCRALQLALSILAIGRMLLHSE